MKTFLRSFSSFSTNDIGNAKNFYEKTLGLDLKQGEMGNLKLQPVGSGVVMIYPKGRDHAPASFTVLNFIVSDIEEAVKEMTGKGVIFEQYGAPIKTDAAGICRNGEGPAIAWFKDPAGNILSLIEG